MHELLPAEVAYLGAYAAGLRDRLRRATSGDGSDAGAMSAEAMIITGILVATALTALGIIGAKVIAKANSLKLG
ncbi:hypothetical protein ACRYCC_32740 [Actinomadura scrupuli]|uniref:hypothetical protein n=1 Tax=Actinomadura scrupuli TaxID=559629 RepID=UPI003D9886C2